MSLFKEDAAATNTSAIPDPKQTVMGPRPELLNMYDRRHRKDKHPVLLKRFRKYLDNV